MKKTFIFPIVFTCISVAAKAQTHANASQQVTLALSNVIIINVGTVPVTNQIPDINPGTHTIIVKPSAPVVDLNTGNLLNSDNNTGNPVEEVSVKSNKPFNITIASADAKYSVKADNNTKTGMVNVEITKTDKENTQPDPSLLMPANPVGTSMNNGRKPLYITYKMEKEMASTTTNIVYTATQA